MIPRPNRGEETWRFCDRDIRQLDVAPDAVGRFIRHAGLLFAPRNPNLGHHSARFAAIDARVNEYATFVASGCGRFGYRHVMPRTTTLCR